MLNYHNDQININMNQEWTEHTTNDGRKFFFNHKVIINYLD